MRPTVERITTSAKCRFVLSLLCFGAGHAPIAMAQSPGTFTATGSMPTPGAYRATLLTNGNTLILSYGSSEIYEPGTGTFTATGDRTTRVGASVTLLPNGEVLIAGSALSGADGSYTSLAHADLYDPGTGTFTPTGDMSVERVGHTATLLNNGKILIAGGAVVVAGVVDRFLASAELYDPSTGTFSATGDMNEMGCDTATLLANGKVLITRSIVYDPPVVSGRENFVRHAELYDPSTGTFAFTGDMIVGHTGPTATLLANGMVLVAGGDIGDGDGATASAELYDPASGTFALTDRMTVGREEHTATLLPDGKVLLAGGHILMNASAELYDPVTGTFSVTGDMVAGRELHTATLLNSGKVLIAGGYSLPTNLTSAELYNSPALAPSPVLFSLFRQSRKGGDGRDQGAILHEDTHQVASSSNPAAAGEALEIYGAGLIDGSVIPPYVTVGGRMAEVLFFGKIPGFAGLNQVNVRVPGGIVPGPAVPVRLTYLGRASNEVAIAVQ